MAWENHVAHVRIARNDLVQEAPQSVWHPLAELQSKRRIWVTLQFSLGDLIESVQEQALSG